MKIKKAQAWGFDLMVGGFIFLVGITTFYLFSINFRSESDIRESYKYDSMIISNSIISEGYPSNWDISNVVIPGIMSQDKVNETKLYNLINMSESDYPGTKNLFGITHEYYITFSEPQSVGTLIIEGFGLKPSNQNNLFKEERVVPYKEKALSLIIYIWD